jgi:hypothetical protein
MSGGNRFIHNFGTNNFFAVVDAGTSRCQVRITPAWGSRPSPAHHGRLQTAIGLLADVSAGGLTNATDRNRKENFLSLDGLAILDKLQRVLVTS